MGQSPWSRRSVAAVLIVIVVSSVALVMWRQRHRDMEPTSIPDLWVRRHEIFMGTLEAHAPARAELELINRGTRPLIVEQVETDCTCAVATLPNQEIPAGGLLKIPVVLDSAKVGSRDFHKRVIVRIASDRVLFHLTGAVDVLPIVAVIPQVVNLGEVYPGSADSVEALIYVNGPKRVVAGLPESIRIDSLADVRMETRYETIGAMPFSKPVKLELHPRRDVPLGKFSLNLHLSFVGEKPFQTRVQVTGQIVGPLVSVPARLYMPLEEPTTSVRVEVASRSGKPINISGVSSDLPLAWSVLSRSEDDRRITFDVRCTEPREVANLTTGHIRMKTSDEAECLDIPVALVPAMPLRSGQAPGD